MNHPSRRLGRGLIALAGASLAAAGLGFTCDGLIAPPDDAGAGVTPQDDAGPSACDPVALKPTGDPNAAVCAPLASGYGSFDFYGLFHRYGSADGLVTDGRDAYMVDDLGQVVLFPSDGSPPQSFFGTAANSFGPDGSAMFGGSTGVSGLLAVDSQYLYLATDGLAADGGCCDPDGGGVNRLLAWPLANKAPERGFELAAPLGTLVPCGSQALGSSAAWGPPTGKFEVDGFDLSTAAGPTALETVAAPNAADGGGMLWQLVGADDQAFYAQAIGLYDSPIGRLPRGASAIETLSVGARAFGPASVILLHGYLYFVRETDIFTPKLKLWFSRTRSDLKGPIEDLAQGPTAGILAWTTDGVSVYYAYYAPSVVSDGSSLATRKVKKLPVHGGPATDLDVDAQLLAVSNECLWAATPGGVVRMKK